MAEYQRKENVGSVFNNKYKTGKSQPDMTGDIVLSKELLKELVERVKEGKEPKLSLSVWKNTSKAGNQYQSVAVKIYTEYKKNTGDIEVPF